MTHCEKCGSVIGVGLHACHRPESRFGEFNPQPIPYEKPKLFDSPEAYQAEVDRRVAEMRRKQVMTLTPRQQEIYEFIRGRIAGGGTMPTVREIGRHFGIRSPNGVMCHLKAIERKGMIIRDARNSRGIHLLDNPVTNAMSVLRDIRTLWVDAPDAIKSRIDAALGIEAKSGAA